MGEPLRAVMQLPGVSAVVSGLAYPVVRGTQPAATAYFLDGIRIPQLFHALAGPSVFNSDFIDRIDFYPGIPPARFGRLLGGAIEATSAKPKDKYQLALDTPDLWVAVFNQQYTWLQEGAPQPLEDAARAIGLHGKTASGDWSGTFDVMNKGWGGAARRFAKLGAEMGVAVLRHDP